MKTVRFTQVVASAGAPEVYLLWKAPKDDREFQRALKAGRIMTVHQADGHTATDYGSVGYEKGGSEQLLVFPKPLKRFSSKRVVGVKYNLVAEKKIRKSEQAKPARPPKPKKQPKPEQEEPEEATELALEESSPHEEAVSRKNPKRMHDGKAVMELKKKVRKAIRLLEQGKQVQAHEALKCLL